MPFLVLTTDDLLTPAGRIEASLFDASSGSGTTEQRVDELIDVILADRSRDAESRQTRIFDLELVAHQRIAAIAWIEHRIFLTKAQELSNQEAIASIDGVSRSWSSSQINFFRSLATDAKTTYEDLIETYTTEIIPDPFEPRSFRISSAW